MKNRADTEAKLIQAVGEVLAEKGFAKIGVNTVARRAGVDKVLIYRYFNGLDGLTTAYAKSNDFWPSVNELLGEGEAYAALLNRPFVEVFTEVLRRYANAIRSRPLTLEIMAWETIERNAITIALEDVRENTGLALMEHLLAIEAPEGDWQAASVIFSSAIHYLSIRARKIQVFAGVDLSQDAEWERLIQNMSSMISNLANQ